MPTYTCMQREKRIHSASGTHTRTRHVHLYIQFLPERTYIQRTTSDKRTTHPFIISIRVRELFCKSTYALCIYHSINPILFLLFIHFLCVIAIRMDLAHCVQFIVHTYTAKMGLLLFLCVLSMAAVTYTPYAAIATGAGWYHSFMYTVTNVSLTSFCGL